MSRRSKFRKERLKRCEGKIIINGIEHDEEDFAKITVPSSNKILYIPSELVARLQGVYGYFLARPKENVLITNDLNFSIDLASKMFTFLKNDSDAYLGQLKIQEIVEIFNFLAYSQVDDGDIRVLSLIGQHLYRRRNEFYSEIKLATFNFFYFMFPNNVRGLLKLLQKTKQLYVIEFLLPHYTNQIDQIITFCIKYGINDLAIRLFERNNNETQYRTSLATSVFYGNVQMLDYLLTHPQYIHPDMQTDLFLDAIRYNHINIVQRLLQEPTFDLTAYNSIILTSAVRLDRVEIVRILLDSGKVVVPPQLLDMALVFEIYIMLLAQVTVDSARLLRSVYSIMNRLTSFHRDEIAKIVKYLIENQLIVPNTDLLRISMHTSQLELVKYFLNHPAIDHTQAIKLVKQWALEVVYRNDLDLLKLILLIIDEKDKDSIVSTMMVYAQQNNFKTIIEFLNKL